jgi:hypothetical protein
MFSRIVPTNRLVGRIIGGYYIIRWLHCGYRAGVNHSHQCTSWGWGCWSCLGDEPKTHPPCPKLLVFSASSHPKNFPSYLPAPSYLLATSHLPPLSYLLPPSTLLPPTYLPPPTSHLIFRSLHCQNLGAVGARAKPARLKLDREREQNQRLKFKQEWKQSHRAWSESGNASRTNACKVSPQTWVITAPIVKALEHLKQDPHKT